MRINDAYTRFNPSTSSSSVGKPGASKAEGSKAPATTAAVSGEGVKVNVSSEAHARFDAAAVGSSERVAALKSSVQSGSYKVDHEKIAAKLVGDDP